MIQMFLLFPSPFLPQNCAIINKVDKKSGGYVLTHLATGSAKPS